MIKILLGVLFVALVATAGDAVWYELGVRHRMIAGILHGAALLTAVGAVLGASAGRLVAGLPLGTAAGIGGALIYYAVVAVAGRRSDLMAMIVAWVSVWIILAFLDGLVLRRGTRSTLEIVTRGLIAAVIGGLAFYAVLDVIWGSPGAGRHYGVQFLAWAVAWAPGIMAIALEAPTRPDPEP
jgi:hypothetical protein